MRHKLSKNTIAYSFFSNSIYTPKPVFGHPGHSGDLQRSKASMSERERDSVSPFLSFHTFGVSVLYACASFLEYWGVFGGGACALAFFEGENLLY